MTSARASSETMVHEYFHLLQGHWNPSFAFLSGQQTPSWLVEGSAFYSEAVYWEHRNLATHEEVYEIRAEHSRGVPQTLGYWAENWGIESEVPKYELAVLAVSWLVEHFRQSRFVARILAPLERSRPLGCVRADIRHYARRVLRRIRGLAVRALSAPLDCCRSAASDHHQTTAERDDRDAPPPNNSGRGRPPQLTPAGSAGTSGPKHPTRSLTQGGDELLGELLHRFVQSGPSAGNRAEIRTLAAARGLNVSVQARAIARFGFTPPAETTTLGPYSPIRPHRRIRLNG